MGPLQLKSTRRLLLVLPLLHEIILVHPSVCFPSVCRGYNEAEFWETALDKIDTQADDARDELQKFQRCP